MPVNRDLIHGRIDIIERNFDFLNEYKEILEEDFLKNYKDIQATKFSLLEIIEAAIDIASHLISIKGFESAESYSEMFEILGKKNILNSELSDNLTNMAKFRKFLVHKYPDVDDSKVLTYINEELGNIRNFIKSILEYIKN